jgi:hypothetical protein
MRSEKKVEFCLSSSSPVQTFSGKPPLEAIFWAITNAKGYPAHADTARTGTPNPPDYPPLSTQDISTTMNKVDNAIADLKSRDHVEPNLYKATNPG